MYSEQSKLQYVKKHAKWLRNSEDVDHQN